MGNKPTASVLYPYPISLANYRDGSARWKYMFVSGVFSLLMIYLVGGALLCLVNGAQVGGAPYRVMVFGTIITVCVFQFTLMTIAHLHRSTVSTSSQLFSPWIPGTSSLLVFFAVVCT
jgi:hypothetical protein